MNNEILISMSGNLEKTSFLNDVMKIACKAGRELVHNALKLWYVLDKPELPPMVRATIMGSLAYLVLPTDAIPDFFPGGYFDDMGALVMALAIASSYVDDEVERKAQEKLVSIMG